MAFVNFIFAYIFACSPAVCKNCGKGGCAVDLTEPTGDLHLLQASAKKTQSKDMEAAFQPQNEAVRKPCATGARVSEVKLLEDLKNSTKTVYHPLGLKFRTKILHEDAKGTTGSTKEARLQSGQWESHQDRWMKRVFDSDPDCAYPIFVDAGAAFGYYSLVAMKKQACRRVQAFNPHPRFAYSMRLNLEENFLPNIISQHVCINQVAVSNSTGTVNFGFGYGAGMKMGMNQRVKVPTTSLDLFFQNHVAHDDKVIMVKLDVEGAEMMAMKGATELLKNCRVKHWAIGIHSKSFVEPITKLLQNSGYRIESASAFEDGQPNGELLASCGQ